jgi:hypothetical protein
MLASRHRRLQSYFQLSRLPPCAGGYSNKLVSVSADELQEYRTRTLTAEADGERAGVT